MVILLRATHLAQVVQYKFVPLLLPAIARKRTERDVTDVVARSGLCSLQLQRRLLVAEQYLRRLLEVAPTLFKFLANKHYKHCF